MRALLYPKQLNPQILKELNFERNELAPLEGAVLDKLIGLVNRILTANYTANSLKALRDQAAKEDPNLEMEEGLLLY